MVIIQELYPSRNNKDLLRVYQNQINQDII